ncbi:hypothetical protein [Marinobacterium arenosum]|uniref:hypothetical protein n=1 Tax=Marinobacterium arenosum TaxID=2862496 RepID=UPI001C941ACD|nr:hypothetical protein [Marinobacterium arenosum]MBY4675833.1 hypothetical protein [Marinobacterium arenosum]
MTLKQAKTLYSDGKLTSAEIMRNPSQNDHWFASVYKKSGKMFMLVDEADKVISLNDLNALVKLVRSVGFRRVLLHV